MTVTEIARRAKETALKLQSLSEDQRVKALHALGHALEKNSAKILEANAKDLDEAKKSKLSSAMIDRLTLTEKSVKGLKEMCASIAAQPRVVGQIFDEATRPNGLRIQKQRIPIGVIGMIFESRPNVVIDGAALAIKSGNAIILKGGKEAHHSNRALMDVIEESVSKILPEGSISLIETREDVAELLKLNQYIDLMVPRGGSALIDHVKKNATMPVVAHDKGLCHIYVHKDADVKRVIPIILNAKVSRPGVCNAVETLLLHKDYPEKDQVIEALKNEGVEIREDYDTEYLDKIISLKVVNDENEAISHIQKHGSHHTEAILAKDYKVIELFMNSLDASAIVVNASTRFNDGGELGLGAELGISTSKLHAYGPMGAKEMTTTRFLVTGNGQIR
jgi:glutamate-5-semialdehyde dehydrogenase